MITAWVLFVAFVVVLLALDLGVFHRTAHAVGMRESLAWSAFWLTLGLSFGLVVFVAYERQLWGLGTLVDPVDGVANSGAAAMEKYLTGYLVEKSLSVDNVFVMSMIFTALAVPARYQHRVLFWGVIGAIGMRGAMIVIGARLIEEFHWILYLFAALLIVTAVKMLTAQEADTGPHGGRVVAWVRRWFPVTPTFHGDRLIVRAAAASGRTTLALTPLAVALAAVEAADLVFAVDSIPAIFAITGDPFLVFTSNVFAMLGLRSLYFALAGIVDSFRYLKPALAIVLLIVGGKMLAADWLKAALGDRFNLYLLAAVALVIAGGVVLSVLAGNPGKRILAAETRP